MSIRSTSHPSHRILALQQVQKDKENRQKDGNRKRTWRDVADDENRPGSSSLPNGSTPRPDKKHKSAFNGVNGHTNGFKPVNEFGRPVEKHAANLQEQRKQLPIAQGRAILIEELAKNDVTVLLGETGSGKTTQVPQYILEARISGSKMVAVTQPRKVAATSLAARVAAEKNSEVGQLVGYAVRFDEHSGPNTRIKYLTDGMLMRELLSDSDLSKYSVVIIDEAHERTLRTDLLIANLKSIQMRRNQSQPMSGKGKEKADPANPLKIVIMSATLDAEKYSKYFDNAKILYVKGRQHAVQVFHTVDSVNDYIDAAMRTFFQIHTDQPPGDVLIFLPGQEDIETLEKSIQLYANRLPIGVLGVCLCPMYAAQAAKQNAKVFASAPPNTRKCILATNIAETSITIPGVKYVIDTGKCKEKRYLAGDTGGGFDTLLTRDITQSSALQRAGRAGREGNGFCYRLYTQEAFNIMPPSAEPEIRRVSLTSAMIQLKFLGQDVEKLDLMDKPDPNNIRSALKTLFLLDALNDKAELSEIGRKMALFPLEPIYSRALLASQELGCTLEVMEIISVLSASSKLFQDVSEQRENIAEARRKFLHPSGDHLVILNVLRAYKEVAEAKESTVSTRRHWCRQHFLNERTLFEAKDIKDQLQHSCKRLGIDYTVSCGDNEDAILQSLAHGLVHNSAFLHPGGYKQIMAPHSEVKIHPSSVLADKKVPAIIYDELIYTTNIYARGVSSISQSFLGTFGVLNKRSA